MKQSRTFVRVAEADDLPQVASLLRSYMAEALDRRWEGDVAALERDGLGQRFNTLVTVDGDSPIGFACWHWVYNVHYCVQGGEVTDMFVMRPFRGRGVALSLITHAARQVETAGGHFLKGHLDRSLERFYARFAVVVPGAECYVGGDPFRLLSELCGRPVRELVRSLQRARPSTRTSTNP